MQQLRLFLIQEQVKKIIIAVTVILMIPTVIASSIPSSIINLISIDQTQDSSSSQVFESKYDEFLTGFQEALSDDLSEDIECREFKANVCVLISYYSIWKDKKIIPISNSKLVSDFKKRIKKADLLRINKKKKTATYRGDDAFAKYLKLSDDEIELGKAQGSVLASIIGIKNDGKVTIDLSSVSDEDGSEYLGVSGAGKTYKLSKSDYETLCKIVAQECSVSYDGALAVVSHMCNMAEYGVPYYRKRGLMGTAKSSWYQAYTSGAYKKRHPANFVKRAVKDAINGKRNIPPYVLEFAAAGSVPKNWRNLEGERYYKRIGDNDYFYNIHDKEKLKKVNSFGEMMIASRHGNTPVKAGDKLAGTRIIPLVIEKEKMEEAISYIRENYAKDLNMAMVSNHICMNYSLFSAAFKEHTGVNFVNYLKEIRIAEAKRLLIQTEDKITEIAKQVGFENDKHFMKSFKTACGVSPSEFRKDYKMVSNGKGGQDE